MWLQRLCGVLGASAAAVAAAAGAVAAAAGPAEAEGAAVGQEWAFPSPYDAGQPSGRFLPGDAFRLDCSPTSRRTAGCWDLAALYRAWHEESSKGSHEETWPWVWVWHNDNGPHHVFYGVDETTLARARAMARASPQNNGLLIVDSVERDLRAKGYSEKDFTSHRCGVIESPAIQLDFAERVLMTADERIIAYDTLYVAAR